MLSFAVISFIVLTSNVAVCEESQEFETVTCVFQNNVYGYTSRSVLTCEIRTEGIKFDGAKILSKINLHVEGLEFGHNKNMFFLPVNVSEVFPNLKEYAAHHTSIQTISKSNFMNLMTLLLISCRWNI